jgi:uncharacterized membrane protein YqjE
LRLLESAQTLLADALVLARTRLELFGTELQEELMRLFLVLLCAVGALMLCVVGAVFAAFSLIVSLGEEQRALASALVALGFFVIAAAALWVVRRLTRVKPRVFDASLTELERDYEALKP